MRKIRTKRRVEHQTKIEAKEISPPPKDLGKPIDCDIRRGHKGTDLKNSFSIKISRPFLW